MELTRREAEDMYVDALNEQGDVVIGNLSYTPSRVLYEVDQIAYQCGLNDFIDSLMEDGYEVEE